MASWEIITTNDGSQNPEDMADLKQAKVKSVLSGDTVILTPVNNPRNERTLSLAFVSAPRLRREGDEVTKCWARYLLPLTPHP